MDWLGIQFNANPPHKITIDRVILNGGLSVLVYSHQVNHGCIAKLSVRGNFELT